MTFPCVFTFSKFRVELIRPNDYEDGQASHGTLSVQRRTRSLRALGMITSCAWFVLIGLSKDEPYGRV